MKKQSGACELGDASSMSDDSTFARSGGSLPSHHHDQAGHDGGIQHRHDMYEQGRRRGWYKKGGRIPWGYHCRRYVVMNWRAAGLPQPRCGYHWVRSNNGDFLLVSINSGIITNIVSPGRPSARNGRKASGAGVAKQARTSRTSFTKQAPTARTAIRMNPYGGKNPRPMA